MYIKPYRLGFFLLASYIIYVVVVSTMGLWNNANSWCMTIIEGFIILLCIIFYIWSPFLWFLVDDYGIQVYQFKRKLALISWDHIKTICIFPVTNGDALYLSTLEISEVEKLVKQLESQPKNMIRNLNRIYSMNPIIWRRTRDSFIRERYFLGVRDYTVRLCTSKKFKTSEEFANELLRFNLQYIKRNGGELVSVFKYPRKIRL